MKVFITALALLGLVLVVSMGGAADTRLAIDGPEFTAVQQVPFDSISVYPDHATIDVAGLHYAKVISNSMAPVITDKSTVLERTPSSADEIKVNDIISFYEPSVDSIVLHLVTEVGSRDGAVYYKTKGVANPDEDPWEVPYSNVKGVLVGVVR